MDWIETQKLERTTPIQFDLRYMNALSIPRIHMNESVKMSEI